MMRSAELWLAEVPEDPDWMASQVNGLTPSESKRLASIVREQRRLQFVAAHALLRQLVQYQSGVDAGDVRIEVADDGRPLVAAPAGWQGSLSHSQRWIAALAQASDTAVGVDVEVMSAQRDIEALVEAALGVQPRSRAGAYRHWVASEAQAKARGGNCFTAVWRDLAIAVSTALPARVCLVDLRLRTSTPIELSWRARCAAAGVSHVG